MLLLHSLDYKMKAPSQFCNSVFLKRKQYLLALPIAVGFSLIGASDASAKIRLKGCIKWWHPAVAAMDQSKAWWPLKKTEVDIEWDGAGKDKSQFTGSKGCYSRAVRNAYYPFDSHKMNVQPYAKRKFRGKSGPLYIRAFEIASDIYPTYVESSQLRVKDNKTGIRNLWLGNNKEFGGVKQNYKKGNLVSAKRQYYYWNLASVDIMGRYYDWAFSKGFKQLRSVDIIAPAWGESAYFNIATNNINMTKQTNPAGSTANFSRWVFTLLHEGTHAMHAHISPRRSDWAPGITRAARHDLYTITSPIIAWTEGFAAFLPVAYLTDRGVLGAYANASYTDAPWGRYTKKISSSSFLENHMNTKGQQQTNMQGTLWGDTSWFSDPNSARRGGSEGFVAGFLWDLTDSSANTQNHSNYNQLRNKINKNSGIRGRGATACQVENTLRRSYRRLPSSNILSADPLLSYSSDCLKLPLSDLAKVLETRMRDNVTTFGAALIKGKSNSVKYEILKAYINNGMQGAVPSGLKSMQNWTLNYNLGARKMIAIPRYGDVGAPSGNTAAMIRSHQQVMVELPVKTQNASDIQFNSARCKLANMSKVASCSTSIDRAGNKKIKVYFKRSDFCEGTRAKKVGERMKSAAFVAIDDGVNPIALPALVCSPVIRGS